MSREKSLILILIWHSLPSLKSITEYEKRIPGIFVTLWLFTLENKISNYKLFSEIKWIYIIRTNFSKGFFCIFVIFMENYTLWLKNFYKKVNLKASKNVWKIYILQLEIFPPIFSKWIYIFCAVQKMLRIYIFCAVSNEEGLCYHTHSAPDESIYCAPNNTIYRFIWREMCVITHSFLRSVRFWRI